MIDIGSPLAAIYSTSTMEHHHFNMAINILQQVCIFFLLNMAINILKGTITRDFFTRVASWIYTI
jgi:hypothetical protein